jgi:K(+)-stimulated pyrophosphate-energized sodium pump
LNPLIKVMNLVALLIAPLVVKYGTSSGGHLAVRIVVSVGATAVLGFMVWYSKSRRVEIFPGGQAPVEPARQAP